MSDMLDRLDQIAAEAGAEAGGRLATPDVTARLQAHIARGVRKRRTVTAALTGALVVVLGTASVIVPKLLETPVPPATAPIREVVNSSHSLLTYSDGSMQVVTSAGKVVKIPAPGDESPRFAGTAVKDSCLADVTQFVPGWTHSFKEASQLMTFGRPLARDESGFHVLSQGQHVAVGHDYWRTKFAFSVDVDPAVAPYVVMTVDAFVVAPDGRAAYVVNQLESRPAIEYSGVKGTQTYTATVTSRALGTFADCAGVSSTVDRDSSAGLAYFFRANVFVNDGHGHVSPLGTHISWITVIKEGS